MPRSKRGRDTAGPSELTTCSCPRELKKLCTQKRTSGRQSITDIIAALSMEEEIKKLMQSGKFKKSPCMQVKSMRKKHKRKSICSRGPSMEPPMEKRMQFIRHCDDLPFKPCCALNENYSKRLADMKRAQMERIINDKKMMENLRKADFDKEDAKTDIVFPYPRPPLKIDSAEEFKVPSPKTSGEVIAAQQVAGKKGPTKPPLPPKPDVVKAHSGIVLNPDKDYAPDYPTAMPRPKMGPGARVVLDCARGGTCRNPKCKRKKCRVSRRTARAKAGPRRCWSIAYAMGGARDGRARSRGRKEFVPDDTNVCGLDDVERPEHPDIPKDLKHGMFETHSLTQVPCKKIKRPDVHYGILLGASNMYSDKFTGKSRGRQALAMSVMAYCLCFHYHPKQWSAKLVDNLLKAGDEWYIQLAEKQHDHSAYQGICEVLKFGKKQSLLLNGKKMQVLLGEPEIVGYAMSQDPMVFNLCRALKAFFCNPCNRACILMSRVLKVSIWRDPICFYVFDPAGRDARAYSNFAAGAAALMNVDTLSSVVEILLTRSVMEDQKFVIAPLKVLKMIEEKADQDLESEPELTQKEKAEMSYRILTENLAIVNANMHLGDRIFEDAKFRQALPIAIAAMTYAKISPPNTWYTKTLDKIMRLGNKLYLDCVQPKVVVDLTIDNIPNEITLGPYACEIIIYRERAKGQLFSTKSCILNIRTGLDEFFSKEYNSGIIDFHNYKLAVWRQKDMYYMFDPYPRTDEGRRSLKTGKACCFMLLHTDAMADIFLKNWDFLPVTTPFYIHAFKVLRLKKRRAKDDIKCLLSDGDLKSCKKKKSRARVCSSKVCCGAHSRTSIPASGVSSSHGSGDGKKVVTVMAATGPPHKGGKAVDEEYMGEIISLVDSIQEDYVPPVPLKYKNMPPEPVEPKLANLDSPTVSVTQLIPPWPKPRDKTNEPPEPDPDREPTPPPTPPPPIPPEGPEEEAEEEELDEEQLKLRAEEELRRRLEEEEARRRAEMLPPPMPPPPPTPQPEPEVPLSAMLFGSYADEEEEMMMGGGECEAATMMEPIPVERYLLLTEDAKKRYKQRQASKKMGPPEPDAVEKTKSEELQSPHNFLELPDNTEIIRGNSCIPNKEAATVLPFASIMAVVVSHKYQINTWTEGIVNFIVDSAKKLYTQKKEDFQNAPLYVLPKITIGHQSYRVTLEVVGEGPTWDLERQLDCKYLCMCDRGIVTTMNYSCAFFVKNQLCYLFDGSSCNAMGVRMTEDKGKGCFLRFKSLHDLVCRILHNKNGMADDQQYVLSKIVVRKLLPEPRYQLPADYDYDTMTAKGGPKSKPKIIDEKAQAKKGKGPPDRIPLSDIRGYQPYGKDKLRILGSTAVEGGGGKGGAASQEHFVCLVAMLMATIHPLRTWTQITVDICIEKGLEIHSKATNLAACEKRVIKNVLIEGKVMNINIKKILVINENVEKTLEQYVKAVLNRLRYVIIALPNGRNVVVAQSNGFYHVFDCQPPPDEEPESLIADPQYRERKDSKAKPPAPRDESAYPPEKAAGWTLYRTFEGVLHRLETTGGGSSGEPFFYTFELTSMRTPNRQSALAYKLSPMFRPEVNPNRPYVQATKPRPIVDEKLYWLNEPTVPWSRVFGSNAVGVVRRTQAALWNDWDIELPGDLYSLWGTLHPRDYQFPESRRGKQYIACSLVALAVMNVARPAAWTSSTLDGIVLAGDKYHETIEKKVGSKANHEVSLEDFNGVKGQFGLIEFTPKSAPIIFGFVYNVLPDRFNLSKALSYFFEKATTGLLISPMRNLAFGKIGYSYFMFDCQTFGDPIFCSSSGSAYILKCESLNRLIFVMTIALNTRGHNQQFHLYQVDMTMAEAAAKKQPPKPAPPPPKAVSATSVSAQEKK